MAAKKSFQYFITVLIIAFTIMTPNVAGYSGGSGTPEAPYQIDDVDGLLELAADTGNYDKCFILTADIDLQGQVFTTAIIAADTVAGNYSFDGTAFTGTFDGNDHKITYFTINGGNNWFLGLFGLIDSGGSVKNLGLENCAVSGVSYVGGLVGTNGGIIRNCTSTAPVSGNGCVGGLVGKNYGTISDCYSTGAVDGKSHNVGGLVGFNFGIINNCYSMGTVSGSPNVGGLVGDNCEGSITNCYSTGAVSGDSEIGGLVGLINYGSITNCYSTGAVNGSSRVGGLVGYKSGGGDTLGSFWDIETSGQTTSAGGTGKTTAQMQDINTFLDASWDFINETANGTCNYWQMPAGGGYPVLSTFNGYIPPEPSGSGTEDDPYVITDANDLGTIWYRLMAYYRLANDIDLEGIEWSMAVTPAFGGVLDGNGFCIKNLSINGAGHLGLFGRISYDGSVKNLGIKNCAVSGVSHSWYIGGLVGLNFGSISDCYSTGAVSGSSRVGGLVGKNYDGSISDCYSAGFVSGYNYVGGLVGWNYDGSISNCHSTGAVSGTSWSVGGLVGYNLDGSISNCYSTGEVRGYRGVGGLVGSNIGIISNCHSTGAVSGTSWCVGGLVGNNYGGISNCYSTGGVSGDSEVGGLVGVNENDYDGGIISNCYSTGEVSGSSHRVGGLVGGNSGIISNCYSTGEVSGDSDVGGLVGINGGIISNCYSTGEVSGSSHRVGGLVGSNYGTISCCYSTGEVSGDSDVGGLVGYNNYYYGSIIDCYSTGTVSGTDYVGGLVGYGDEGTVTACFWDVNTSGKPNSAGGTGLTTAQMQTRSTFTDAGWDFNTPIWTIDESVDYPRLWWEECPEAATLLDVVSTMLDPNSLKNENMKNALINKINAALKMIDEGLYEAALGKLENDILAKTNGCAETGEPDKNDWIITCEGQEQVYPLVIETIEYVRSLME